MTLDEINDRLKHISKLIQSLTKEQEQLFLKREEQRQVNEGQMIMEDI